jgi:L-lactate dehydrogenase complex protein LldE
LAGKTYEILSFLSDVMQFRPSGVSYDGVATYHDSCSGLRELGVHDQPRALLGEVADLKMVPLEGNDACCGFGGTFCVKYPDISNAIVEDKTRCIARSGADTLLAGDLGCLMNMAGKISREKRPIKVFHTVEVLAGMADDAGICAPDKGN